MSVFVNTTAMVVSCGMKLGPVDLSSDVAPQVKASSGQEWY